MCDPWSSQASSGGGLSTEAFRRPPPLSWRGTARRSGMKSRPDLSMKAVGQTPHPQAFPNSREAKKLCCGPRAPVRNLNVTVEGQESFQRLRVGLSGTVRRPGQWQRVLLLLWGSKLAGNVGCWLQTACSSIFSMAASHVYFTATYKLCENLSLAFKSSEH